MKTDSIFPYTRITSIILLPFLWLAFLILYFFPDTTGERFAWLVQPHLTSMYMGAGYLGGSWLFINAGFRKRWHRVHGGFVPITVFTWIMLIDTILHWDRFAHGTFGFSLWIFLYSVTPFLIPILWLYNRQTDPRQPEEADVLVEQLVIWAVRLFGIVGLVAVIEGLVYPEFLMLIWPWPLTSLTAHILCGWIALLSMGAFVLASDPRWSSWRVPLQSIFIWHVLVMVAIWFNPADLTRGSLNWYTISVYAMLIAIGLYYPVMENRRKELSLQEPSHP